MPLRWLTKLCYQMISCQVVCLSAISRFSLGNLQKPVSMLNLNWSLCSASLQSGRLQMFEIKNRKNLMEPVDVLQESRQAELAVSYHYTNMAHQADYTSAHSQMHPSQGDRSRVNAPGCSLNLQKPYIRLVGHHSVSGVAYLCPPSSHLSSLPTSLIFSIYQPLWNSGCCFLT